MVGSVEFAVSKEEARQALTGIRMEFEGDTLRLVATDTHRLAVRTARIDSGAGEPTAAIVPLKAIQLVQKIPAGETITLQLGQHRAAFLGENAAVYTQLIEGQYPNYQRVIPQEFTRQWTLMTQRVDLVRVGDDLEIAFNARYLLDVLDVVKSEGVVLELTEALRPAVVKPAELDDYLCVIMPMAL
jgi:DNA polymerase-3 subunit beta